MTSSSVPRGQLGAGGAVDPGDGLGGPADPGGGERRHRAEAALTSVVATCYLLGVSTRRMEKLVESLGITRLSKSQVSAMAQDLDAQVAAFRTRPLDAGPYLCVAADATRLKHRGSVADPRIGVPRSSPAPTPVAPPPPGSRSDACREALCWAMRDARAELYPDCRRSMAWAWRRLGGSHSEAEAPNGLQQEDRMTIKVDPELLPRRTAWRAQALADDWELSVKAVYALIASGELRSVKAGRHHLIPDTEVQR